MRSMVVVGVLLVGCVKNITPPAAPAQEVPIPSVEIGPPAEGESTVLIGADRPAAVEEVLGITEQVAVVGGRVGVAQGVTTSKLCNAPCAVNLRQGLHSLIFTTPSGWAGNGEVQVGVQLSAYRYALGYRKVHPGLLIGGYTLATIGLIVPIFAILEKDSTTQIATVGAGAGALTIGIVMMVLGATEVQNGTGVQWTPPPMQPPQAVH